MFQKNCCNLHSINWSTSQPILMDEKEQIVKFSVWLKSNTDVLLEFLRSINWDKELEVNQAVQVLRCWGTIDACNALELLGPTFKHPIVRRYAVSCFRSVTTSILLLYLPQLVQSLRYETPTIENGNEGEISQFGDYAVSLPNSITEACFEIDMSTFLIDTACRDQKIANFLFWYLKVEASLFVNPQNVYSEMVAQMRMKLERGSTEERNTLNMLDCQCNLVNSLVNISSQLAELGGSLAKKLNALKEKLAEIPNLLDLNDLPLPLDPSICVKRVQSENVVLFSSNSMPMCLTFSTSNSDFNSDYMTIFKRGDDLRQDQLVLQMISLIDNLLKNDGLDLRLTSYSVLPTSSSDGFVQYIKATPIADLKDGILETLRVYRPSETGPFGIEEEVLENFVRSCAGYSIICYILGIGDRHMHNVMLREDGRMFHIDFEYILGRDPKPMAPLIRLTSNMITAMGGKESEYFNKFIDYCTASFLIIRRNANLVINPFSLMLDANISGIEFKKETAVNTILERFQLQLSEEDACKEIIRIIHASINAKMPVIFDFMHNVKQMIS